MHGTSNMYVAGSLYARGYGNSGHILLEDSAVLSTNVLNTGFGGSGDTNIDIWGGKLIARANTAHYAGTLNIDIRNNGELVFPIGLRGILEGWIGNTLVGDGGATAVLLRDDIGTGTVTAYIPEPATMSIIALGSMFCLRRRRV